MQRSSPSPRFSSRLFVVALATSMLVLAAALGPAHAAPSKISGSGSTYVGLAMQQWTSDAHNNGLNVNYLPTGSPQGLNDFKESLVDFAATEAEYSAIAGGVEPARGHQYVPSVAGAIAIMYNVRDQAGKKVNYLHLSRKTVARIFMGDIKRWSDAAITADNQGIALPDEKIKVVYRNGQSGTTALFYDFNANVAPEVFGPWAAQHGFPTSTRIVDLSARAPFGADNPVALNGSDQIAQYIAADQGLWAIGYDEFGYAKTYKAEAAWIQNQSGQWVLPFAENISAALESATLRPDLSQELSGVYNSTKDQAYPISAYSYIVTQCEKASDRATCKGKYSNAGTAETLTKWLRYIACEGQTNMAKIGYSPLPTNLSQEVANSIARMNGEAPEQLSAGNCKNPRFSGGFNSPPRPPDPLEKAIKNNGGNASGSGAKPGSQTAANGSAGASASGGATSGASGPAAEGEATAGEAATSEAATSEAAAAGAARAGGSADWRDSQPVLYQRPNPDHSMAVPIIILLALLAVPAIVSGIRRRRE